MFFRFDDSSVRMVGRWVKFDDSAVTTAPGSKFEIAFKGDLITLYFDMNNNVPTYPHLWISVDGGAQVESTLDHYIKINCGDGGNHILTVVFKSAQEITNRWLENLEGKVEFSGYDAENNAVLPESTKKTVEFVGDSITEGVTVDATYSPVLPKGQLNRPYQNDSMATYAAIAAKLLDLEPVFAGYGAVGTTKSGLGNVPCAAEMYPYCFEGHPVEYAPCDYIVINHGTNDRKSPDLFCEKYRELLDVIVKHNPKSNIIAMVPFIGAFRQQIFDVVSQYNSENGTDIFVVDTEGWISPEPLHPNREGHLTAGRKLAEILKRRYNI